MSEHHACVSWKRATSDFSYETYNRDHKWTFQEGVEVEASAAPGFHGTSGRLDPEEAFVAALSSCHMLTFLGLAARRRLVVDTYKDDALGYLDKRDDGKMAITRVVLNPEVTFSGKQPPDEELDRLHHLAHENCYIANSVRTVVSIGS